MKNLVSIIIFLFLICSFHLIFSQGIEFKNLSFDEAKDLAKKEDKLIFIDCYTEWCGPCKVLASTTFMEKEVGDYFNEKFINIKFDMEKGEGMDLAKQFAIRAFPTLLLIDSEGKIVFRTEGAPNEVGKFIDLFEKGLQPNMILEEIELEYNSGEISNKRMLDYIFLLLNNQELDKVKKLHIELLSRLTDEEKLSNDFREIVMSTFGNIENPENVMFILNNYDYLKNQGSENQINNVIDRLAWLLVRNVSLLQMDKIALHEKYVDSYIEHLEKIDFPDKKNIISCLKMVQTFCSNEYSKSLSHLLEIDLDKINPFDAKSILDVLKEINRIDSVSVKQFVEQKKGSINSIEDIASKMLITSYFDQF